MRFIDAKQVHQLLDYPSLVDALAENHKNDVDPASSVLLQQPTPAGDTSYFLASAAWQKGKALGSKLVTVFPDNEHNASGLPSVQAVYVLFDGATGKPNAWIDGTALTLRKTA
ncbi:MAG: ornithine cyclodeaminase family protein, partial [Verrucomicrobiales bacterium]